MSARGIKKKKKGIKYKNLIKSLSFPDENGIMQDWLDIRVDFVKSIVWMLKEASPEHQKVIDRILREICEASIVGEGYLHHQAKKSVRKRTTIDADERVSVTSIISDFANERDALGEFLKTKDLWPRFISKLDTLGVSPKEDKFGVVFDGGETTKRSFSALLSRERKKIKNKSAT